MTRITPLNPIDHGDLRVVAARGSAWGDAVNRVPVFPTEFEAAQRDFPILFGRDEDGARQAFALLGLDRDENLFLDGERWSARHLPALLARGPFSIGVRANADGTREPMVHVDLDHPRVTAEGGEPLFLSHGGTAPYLEGITAVLRTIHLGHEAQGPMFAAFEAEGLIAPVRLEVQLDDTLRYDLVDFETIGADAFAALDGAALGRLHSRGFLAPALYVLASLGTMSDLIARKNRRRGGA